MRTFKFYGESDDLFYIEDTGCEFADETSPKPYVLVDSRGAGVIIDPQYGKHNGCWSMGIVPIDEDVEIPEWKISMKLGGRGYSTELSVETEDDVDCIPYSKYKKYLLYLELQKEFKE